MNIKKENINTDNLNDIAPFLSKIDKKNPFVVPDDYFDNLPLLIQKKCTKRQNINFWSKIYEYFLTPKHAITIAFGVILILISSIFIFNNINDNSNNNSFSYIENIIKENYDIDNIDESLIVETLLSEVDTNDIANLVINNDIEMLNSDDIIDYLSDNIDDVDLVF